MGVLCSTYYLVVRMRGFVALIFIIEELIAALRAFLTREKRSGGHELESLIALLLFRRWRRHV
jgi:hypothetical protein